ncbi:DUF4347 domain-containing protein, partial [Candidatus Magnetaquicoccus inordinatus]|uniref:DUF4347 domain-containing protein n=1 Tax=Candidatus Magnetaquicoccus inordinatus TaxID=2496818 RepID=UPI00102AB70F
MAERSENRWWQACRALWQRWRTSVLSPPALTEEEQKGDFWALEARLMFDGVGLAEKHPLAEPLLPLLERVAAAPEKVVAEQQELARQRREIVFIDSRVEQLQSLLQHAKANETVVVLDGARDGVEQIAQFLAGSQAKSGGQGYDAIHIVSHGQQGALLLGSAVLSNDNLPRYAERLRQWGEALTAQGDLLLYGCQVGEGEGGRLFLQHLAEESGADVAASQDLTGAAALGGNWNLEVSSGSIESSIAFTSEVQKSYSGVLAALSVTNLNDDGSAGSLRNIITSAQTNGQADTISFDSSLSGTIYLQSVISITLTDGFSLTIDGGQRVTLSGDAQQNDSTNYPTTLDTSNKQIFSIGSSSTVTLQNLTFTHGYATNGGAIYDNGTLVVDSCVFDHNYATTAGGAILVNNNRSLTVSNSVFIYNKATDGGAIRTNPGSALNISSSLISNNTATSDGGGIYVSSGGSTTLILNSSTITDNTAPTDTDLRLTGTALTTFSGSANYITSTTGLPAGFSATSSDTIAPTKGTITAAGVTTAGATAYSFSVVYNDTGTGIDLTSLTTGDVTVKNASNTALTVTGVQYSYSNTTAVTATYTVTPLGGSWDYTDNGTYTIAIVGSQVSDAAATVHYVAVDANAATFTVNIPHSNSLPTGAVSISGTTAQNSTLTASNTLVDSDGLGTISYQWQDSADGVSGWANIAGASSATYVPPQALVGKYLRVVASYTDGYGTAESVASSASTAVSNVNDAPAITSGSSATLAENSANGSLVYTVTSSDVDSGDTALYSLGGADAAAFTINSSSGAVTLNAAIDYESKSSYNIAVTVTDSGGLTATQAVTVAITNVNEAPSISSGAVGSVAENAATSTVIYTATGSDPDAGDTLSYTLGGADAALLNINSATGAVTLQSSANYESKASYSFTVIATDGGSLTASQAVTISVNDLNEVPVLTSAATASVNENAATSTVVYTVTSTDVDAGSVRSYSVSGTDAAYFSIDSATGALTLNTSANYESK